MLPDSFFIRPSLLVSGLLLLAMLMSIAACWIIPAPLVYRGIAAAVFIIAFAAAFKRRVWHHRRGLRLLFRRGKEVSLLNHDGIIIHSGIITDRFISSLLSTVIIDSKHHRFALMLMPDSLPANDYRQLRIRLNDALTAETIDAPHEEHYSYLPRH